MARRVARRGYGGSWSTRRRRTTPPSVLFFRFLILGISGRLSSLAVSGTEGQKPLETLPNIRLDQDCSCTEQKTCGRFGDDEEVSSGSFSPAAGPRVLLTSLPLTRSFNCHFHPNISTSLPIRLPFEDQTPAPSCSKTSLSSILPHHHRRAPSVPGEHRIGTASPMDSQISKQCKAARLA